MTVCYQRRVVERKRYITPEGYETLRAEADQLWRVERPRVTREVADAAAQGDRSENAEYIYGKKRLREIDSRVRFLNKRLEDLTVVDAPPGDRERIFFGAWVTLEDEEGEAQRYRLVGPDESSYGFFKQREQICQEDTLRLMREHALRIGIIYHTVGDIEITRGVIDLAACLDWEALTKPTDDNRDD